jgi:hypothetical protein
VKEISNNFATLFIFLHVTLANDLKAILCVMLVLFTRNITKHPIKETNPYKFVYFPQVLCHKTGTLYKECILPSEPAISSGGGVNISLCRPAVHSTTFKKWSWRSVLFRKPTLHAYKLAAQPEHLFVDGTAQRQGFNWEHWIFRVLATGNVEQEICSANDSSYGVSMQGAHMKRMSFSCNFALELKVLQGWNLSAFE